MGAVYVVDKHNNYFESLTKEEIIALIETAAAGGNLKGFSNTAFVSKIREVNKKADFSVWVGTQAEYNALPSYEKNILYLISDDPLCNDLPNKVAELVIAQKGNDEKFKGYDATEKELKEGFAEVKETAETLIEGFAKVKETAENVAGEFDEVKAEFEETKLAYEAAAVIKTIFEKAEGSEYAETTQPITNFTEICVVYKFDTTENYIAPQNQQQRFFVADIDEYIGLNDSLIGAYNSDTNKFEINTVTAFWNVIAVNVGYPSHHTKFRFLRAAANIAEAPTCKIYKIYGIGEVQ